MIRGTGACRSGAGGQVRVHRRLVREALMRAEPDRADAGAAVGRSSSRSRQLIDGGCGRTWTRRASSGTRRPGSTPGCWMSIGAGHVVCGRPRLRGPAPAGDPHRGGPRPGEGVHPAASPARHRGRGRLRELSVRLAGSGQVLPVRVPDVAPSGKAVHLVSATCGQEPSWKAACTPSPCWAASRPGRSRYDNLTPAVTRCCARAGRGSRTAVDGVPVALPVRGVLLRARHRGRAREGRRRGPGRVLPPRLLVPVPEIGSLAD